MRMMTDEQANALRNDARVNITPLIRGEKFRIVSGEFLPDGWFVEIRVGPSQELRAFQKIAQSGCVYERKLV